RQPSLSLPETSLLISTSVPNIILERTAGSHTLAAAVPSGRWKGTYEFGRSSPHLEPTCTTTRHCGSDFLAVDRCLDSGGVLDYAAGRRRSDVEHLPYSLYIVRY